MNKINNGEKVTTKLEGMETVVNDEIGSVVSSAIGQQDITPKISSSFIKEVAEAVKEPSTRLTITFKKKSNKLCVYAVVSFMGNMSKKIHSAVDEELLTAILKAMQTGDVHELTGYQVEGKSPLTIDEDTICGLFKRFMETPLRKRIESDFTPEVGKTYKHMVFTIARFRQVEFFIEDNSVIQDIISRVMKGTNE